MEFLSSILWLQVAVAEEQTSAEAAELVVIEPQQDFLSRSEPPQP
jgi:hypothetical protein